ncbi:MAG: hypothetical protein JSU94_17380 [Phycisphaerales bacterium]|nr:MAG: hypothetical protein JSU94_17380 [Phycisphaerales bacterium]
MQEGHEVFSMYADLRRKYFWVMKLFRYSDRRRLLANLERRVVGPAEDLHAEILGLPQATAGKGREK